MDARARGAPALVWSYLAEQAFVIVRHVQRVHSGAAAAAGKVHALEATRTLRATRHRCEVKHSVRCGVGAVVEPVPLEAEQRHLQPTGRRRRGRSQRNQRKEERHKRQRHAARLREAAEGGAGAGGRKRPPVGAPPPPRPLAFCRRTFHCHLAVQRGSFGSFWCFGGWGGECGRVPPFFANCGGGLPAAPAPGRSRAAARDCARHSPTTKLAYWA